MLRVVFVRLPVAASVTLTVSCPAEMGNGRPAAFSGTVGDVALSVPVVAASGPPSPMPVA